MICQRNVIGSNVKFSCITESETYQVCRMLNLNIPLDPYNRSRDIDGKKVPTICPILFECYTIYDCIIQISPFGLVEKNNQ